MRRITIGPDEAGQRFDKFLHKYMREAPAGFFYKMMRKKNITLNGVKCGGGERLAAGDEVCFFLAEETLEKFGASAQPALDTSEYERAFGRFGRLQVLYEDGHILAVNKPTGMLSQKAAPSDLSLNEWLIGYLLKTGQIDKKRLATFRPSVCNRLDRNTSGIVLCGKSLEGTQLLAEQIRSRSIRKYYRLMVKGALVGEREFIGWLKKDARTNRAEIGDSPAEGAVQIKTGVRPLMQGRLPGGIAFTCAEAELFTGKTHQIRAQLSHAGYPLLGDEKYGDARTNAVCKGLGVKAQLLHACRVEFPDCMPEAFLPLSGKVLTAKEPAIFDTLRGFLKEELD